MKTKLAMLAPALLLSMTALTPALAQDWNHQQGGPPAWDHDAFWRGAPDNPWKREEFLSRRIIAARANGALPRPEANQALAELRNIDHETHAIYRHNGNRLNPDDMAHLNAQLDQLSAQLHWGRRVGW